MLYSSCKNNLVEILESQLKIEIEKKVRRPSLFALSLPPPQFPEALLFNVFI